MCWDKNVACLGFYGYMTDFGVIAWIELPKRILRPFDYTAFAVSGKVGILQTGLTTSVGWLLLLQLTVLSRSAIVV